VIPALVKRLLTGRFARIAAQGLTRSADERAIPALIEFLTATTDRRMRNLAGQALARRYAMPLPPPCGTRGAHADHSRTACTPLVNRFHSVRSAASAVTPLLVST
jgi:hypothetical protein